MAQHVISGKRLQPTEQMLQVAGIVFKGCLESVPSDRPPFSKLVEQLTVIYEKLQQTTNPSFLFDDVEDEVVNVNRRVSFAEPAPRTEAESKSAGYKVITFQRSGPDEAPLSVAADASTSYLGMASIDKAAEATSESKHLGFSYV